jgi:ketosteroid isomerase-like protein
VTGVELIARLFEAIDQTGEPDWSLVRSDFEVHDHELLDSAVHRGRAGWKQWASDWQQAFENYRVEHLDQFELDEDRVLTVHRLFARGRHSGVELERTDARLWTFKSGRPARLDYYPDFRPDDQPWSSPGD